LKLIVEKEILIKTLKEEHDVLVSKLKNIRSAIVGLGGEISDDLLQDFLPAQHVSRKEMTVPPKYELGLLKVQKIAYAISHLGGEAFASEIIEFIMTKEEELKNEIFFTESLSSVERELLKRKITLLISYLNKRGSLTSARIRGKYKYRINKKST
jgi:hypothetical protein